MKFLKSDVVAVCEALDYHTASKWNRKRMAEQVRKIAEARADDELEIGEDVVEDDAERERLMVILDALSKAEEIEFVVDKADLDDDSVVNSSAVESEPDEPIVDSTEEVPEESEPESDDSESAVEPEEEDDSVEPEVVEPDPAKDEETKPDKPKRKRRGRKKSKEERLEEKKIAKPVVEDEKEEPEKKTGVGVVKVNKPKKGKADKPKGNKNPKKEKKAKVDGPKKGKKSSKKDGFGNRLGTKGAKFCVCLMKEPKTMKELKEASGDSQTQYNLMRKLVAVGLVVKEERGFRLP